MNQAGGWVHDRGRSNRQEQIAVTRAQRRLDVQRIERFTEPDDCRPRQTSTRGTAWTAVMVRRTNRGSVVRLSGYPSRRRVVTP